MLGNGIILSVIAGVRFLQGAKIFDFWHGMARGTGHTLLYGVPPRST